MEKYNADLLVSVNLNEVAQYHGSIPKQIDQLVMDGLSTDVYQVTIKVSVIALLEENELHPAYTYFDYAKTAGISEDKANHLIYVVYLLCKYEWNIYNHALLTQDSTREISLPNNWNEHDALNLIDLALNELKHLRLLCQFLEDNLNKISITINHKSNKPRNKEAKGHRDQYIVENLDIKSVELVTPILETAIETHFKAMQNSPNVHLTFAIAQIETPTYNSLQKAIESLPPQPTQDAAISTFRKLVAECSLTYLNNETNLKSKPNEISPDQAEIIYSILALFRIIDFELIDRHADRTSRVKYVRSLLFNTGNLKPQKYRDKKEAYSFGNITFENIQPLNN